MSDAIKHGIRTADSFHAHVRRTGKTPAGDLVWTSEEKAILCKFYPDYGAALVHLPRRTRYAAIHQARSLGIVVTRQRWPEREARLLARSYRAGISLPDLKLMFASRTEQQIKDKVQKLKVRRPAKPPFLTGMAMVDEIRHKAHALNYEMWELDAETGGGKYFRSPRRHNWRKISAALKYLGGRVVPEWPAK